MNVRILLVSCVLCCGCAHTSFAPLKPLKASESTHTLYTVGYQYQRGITDNLEFGLGLTVPYYFLNGNVRYHLNRADSWMNSMQLSVDLSGATGNYMFTFRTGADDYYRFGPNVSYQLESKHFEGPEKMYSTIRLGGSFAYGGKHWWMMIGYSHPVYKNYNVNWRPFSSSDEMLLYGESIFSPEFRFGYSF